MTVQVAFFPLPSVADAVIVVVPAFFGYTVPLLTVATVESEEVQVNVLFVASLGKTVAVSVELLPPTVRLREEEDNETEVTSMGLTVTVHEPYFPLPSEAVALMVAVPGLTAVTRPFTTVATSSLEELQFTALMEAFDGETVAVTVEEPPTFNVRVLGLRPTEVT